MAACSQRHTLTAAHLTISLICCILEFRTLLPDFNTQNRQACLLMLSDKLWNSKVLVPYYRVLLFLH